MFGSSTDISEGHQTGIKSLLSLARSNALSNALPHSFNLFHQKSWIPAIPGAVQFFLFLVSLSLVSSLRLNSFTLAVNSFTLLAHFLYPWHFRCSIIFFPYVSPKFNKFLHLWPLAYMLCPSFYFFFKKKFFWSLSKLALSIIRLFLSMSFWSLIFFYITLSIQLCPTC